MQLGYNNPSGSVKRDITSSGSAQKGLGYNHLRQCDYTCTCQLGGAALHTRCFSALATTLCMQGAVRNGKGTHGGECWTIQSASLRGALPCLVSHGVTLLRLACAPQLARTWTCTNVCILKLGIRIHNWDNLIAYVINHWWRMKTTAYVCTGKLAWGYFRGNGITVAFKVVSEYFSYHTCSFNPLAWHLYDNHCYDLLYKALPTTILTILNIFSADTTTVTWVITSAETRVVLWYLLHSKS